jgi:hypothetical protein
MTAQVRNLSMRRKLEKGDALDVEEMLATAAPEPGEIYAGTFHLDRFVEDVDYCAASTEQWIWSIGRRKSDGEIFAAIDTRFYNNPGFHCLWLR